MIGRRYHALRRSQLRRLTVAAASFFVFAAGAGALWTGPAAAACANPVACENQLSGDPPSDWQVNGVGDSSLQGFATSISVNAGQTVSFKIDNTSGSSYHIDILRLGYYGGDGARKVAPSIADIPAGGAQPACLTDSSTGLIDCGKWSVSASWSVPSTAVSGVYIAHLVRDDGRGSSQIVFVVRNDSSHSAILLSTSDATWEAYNDYGGNSLYSCGNTNAPGYNSAAGAPCPPGNPQGYKAAFAVSYNRPFDGGFNTDGGASYLYYAEYQMIRWFEKNGYDISYTSSGDVDRAGSLLLNHKVFVSSGHDEYWSAGQRANVTAARDAGVNLAFFSGNEIFWKTRWANSSDGSNTPYRTLITYKESHFNAPTDPQDPPTWTGAWADPRFSPPADGGNPANALTGQQFEINAGTATIKVPYQYSKLRIWRDTSIASLAPGGTDTLGDQTLGYEWDEDLDNGFRPPGEFDLSSTTVSGVQAFTDYATNVTNSNSTATHNLTLYRAKSGALVFGAGTVQWSWGLDNTNAWSNAGAPSDSVDSDMQQATVNLFADMGAQAGTLGSGLVQTSASTDTAPPASKVTSPTAGQSFADGGSVTVSGTATDSGGGVVAGVEISTDGGKTWHPTTISTPASTTVSWSYTWIAHGSPSTTIETRATDDSGNIETPSDAISVNVNCPCSIWGTNVTPGTIDSGDPSSVELGVKFTADTSGQISGIRFYKSTANTGTHIGSLWTSSGTLLAQVTFTSETSSGWQTALFSSPVSITAGTTYVAGYFDPNGHYSADDNYFYSPPPTGGHMIDSPPLHALQATATTGNGLYTYTGTPTFPTSSFFGENDWVDVLFTPTQTTAPGQVTGVSATAGPQSATVNWSAPSGGGTPTSYTITPYIGTSAQNPTTVTAPATSANISGLTAGTAYTFTVQASNSAGSGPVSAHSNSVSPTAAGAPGAPTNVSASPASSQAQVSWTPPSSNGGAAITGYTITPYIGTAAQTSVPVSSGSATSATVTGLTNGTPYTFTVTATNGQTGPASAASNSMTPEDTIFDFTAPASSQVDSGDPASVELGVKFTASSSGQIVGLRFYKASTNTGTHVGTLWTASGTQLAQATFTNESASGWQTVLFSSPVSVTAGTTYVAGYLAPNGHYSATGQGFNSAVTNGPLTAVANSTSANGVYAYGAATTFPTNTYQSDNYWMDVLYAPAATTVPGQVTGVSATAGPQSATVKWSPPTTGGAPTSYTITPYVGTAKQTTTTVDGSSTTATVNSLTAGTAYTFTVTASNSAGPGPASAQSNSVTPTAGSPPPAFVQQVTGHSPATTGLTLTPTSNITAGNRLIVEVGVWSAGNATAASVTDSAGNTYTELLHFVAADGTEMSVWSAPITAGGGSRPTITVKPSANADVGAAASEYSGLSTVANASVVDQAAHASGTTGAAAGVASGATPATTGANELAVGMYVDSGFGDALTSGSGWVQRTDVSPTADMEFVSEDQILSAAGATPNATAGTGANTTWLMATVVFKSGATVSPTAPAAPAGVTAAAGNGSATVSWTAPATGGSPITKYTVTPYVGTSPGTPTTITGTPPATSTTITGLTNGTTYTFQVTASNSIGTGPAGTSNAVTPSATPPPAPSFVQQATAHGTSVASLSVTPGANITTGHRMIVLVGVWSGSNATAASVTDSAGNTYSELLHFTASDGTEMSVWSAPVTAGSGTRPAITVKPTSNADVGVSASEYSGLSTASGTGVLDQSAHTSGTTGTAATVSSGATPATTASGELALGFYVDSGFGDTLTVGSGFTQRSNVSNTSDMEFLTEDQSLASTGATPNASVATGANTTWLMATVALKHA